MCLQQLIKAYTTQKVLHVAHTHWGNVNTGVPQRGGTPKRYENEGIPFRGLQISARKSHLAYLNPEHMRTEMEGKGEEIPIYLSGSPKQDTQAYIWISESEGIVYVCFRGTESTQDILADIDVRREHMELESKEGGVISVHRGFYRQYKAIRAEMMKYLEDRREAYRTIVFTGHSLGGAVATIAAAECAERFKKEGKEIECHTFGSPRVGNKNFVKWFNKNIEKNWRVFNADDPVPLLPMSYHFSHVGKGIRITDSMGIQVSERDTPWYLRPILSFATIDVDAIIRDHACTLYISRLESLGKE
jgi:Lipase (class 3)